MAWLHPRVADGSEKGQAQWEQVVAQLEAPSQPRARDLTASQPLAVVRAPSEEAAAFDAFARAAGRRG
jgi:hypothetical protein